MVRRKPFYILLKSREMENEIKDNQAPSFSQFILFLIKDDVKYF